LVIQADTTAQPLTGLDDPTLTLADVLGHVRGGIGEALIGVDAAAQLARIADAVPAALAPFWGVEIRLSDPLPHADILWEVRRDSRGAALLAGTAEGEDRLAGLCDRSPVWHAMRRFAERWDAEGVGVHVGNLWFEADAAAARTNAELDRALAKPCLFWGARAGTLARLCLRRVRQGEAEAWLAAIGWPGDPAAAFARLAPYLSAAHSFALNVDLLDGLTGPKLGVELYREPGDIDPAHWLALFAALEADGLALPAKSAAVLRYPGSERLHQSRAWRRLRTGWGYPTLTRSIHHVKLVATPDGVREAKAYLGAYRPAFNYGAVFGKSEMDHRDAWLEP
jgi:hypothetical protein